MSRALLTPDEAASSLSISATAVRRFIRDGLLKAQARPGSKYVLAQEDVDLFSRLLGEFRADYQKNGYAFINIGIPFVRLSGVYFVGSTDHIKIGVAKDIAKRLRDLQVSHPTKLKLLLWEEGRAAREKELHRLFSQYRESGEWFRFEGGLRDYISQRTAWYWGLA